MNQQTKLEMGNRTRARWANYTPAQRHAVSEKMKAGHAKRKREFRKVGFTTFKVPNGVVGKLMRIPWVGNLLSEKASKKAQARPEPKVTQRHIKAIKKALVSNGQAFVRLATTSGKIGIVPSRFYDVKLRYPMNRAEHPIHTR